MNEEDIFRKLGYGLKFDEANFQKNLQRFHSSPSKPFLIADLQPSSELNFFQRKNCDEPAKENRTIEVSVGEKKTKRNRPVSEENQNNKPNTLDNDSNQLLLVSKTKPVCSDGDSVKENKLGSMKYLRKMYKIYVEGSDVPGLIVTFKQLHTSYNFNKTCLKNIAERMEFTSLTPIQMQVLL